MKSSNASLAMLHAYVQESTPSHLVLGTMLIYVNTEDWQESSFWFIH